MSKADECLTRVHTCNQFTCKHNMIATGERQCNYRKIEIDSLGNCTQFEVKEQYKMEKES